MNITKLLSLVTLSLFVVACAKKEVESPTKEEAKYVSFSISAEDPVLKAGTEIYLFDGKESSKQVLEAKGNAFSFTAQVDEKATSFLAFYPYSKNVNATSTAIVEDVLSASQTAVSGSFPTEGIKYVSQTTGVSFNMSRVCGYLKFKVEEEGYSTFTISGNDSEVLAGPVSINCESDIPLVSAKGSEEIVTLNASGGFVPGEWYYVAIIPQSLRLGANCILRGVGKEERSLTLSDKISAGINQEAEIGTFKKPKPKEDYYVVSLDDFIWSSSNVYYIKDADGKDIAFVAREYFGSTLKRQGVVVYPIINGVADYTKGTIAQITKIDNSDPGDEALNIHGGTLSITDMNPDNVVYVPGTSTLPLNIYIKAKASDILIEEPENCNLLNAVAVPLILKTDIMDHPATKVGTKIWLASDLKTTKYNDGSPIAKYNGGEAVWEPGTSVMVIHNNGSADYYMYNGFAIGFKTANEGENCTFTDRISPDGWRLPTAVEYAEELCGFCGNDLNVLKNLSLIKAANCYKVINSKGTAKVSSLGYTSSWTSTPATTPKAYLAGLKGDGTIVNAPQDIFNAFSVRLVKE